MPRILSSGFDARLWKGGSESHKESLPAYLIETFDRLDPGFLSPRERAQLREMVAGLDYSAYYENPGPRRYPMALPRRMLALLAADPPMVQARLSVRETALARRLLENLIGLEAWLETVGQEAATPRPNRDALMAANLIWLARERHPDRKIIVWAHNFHIMTSLYTLSDEEVMKRAEESASGGPMGMLVRRALGADYYAIGFTGYAGAHAAGATRWKETVEIPPPPPGSLGALLHETGGENLFLDLRSLPPGHWLRKPTTARFYFWRPARTLWSRVFDAVFYTAVLYPTTPLG